MSGPNFFAAQHLIALDRPKEALRKLAEDFDPEDPWDWWLRALALLQLDSYDEAIEAAQRGLALDPESTPLLAVLARVRLQQDDLAAAEEAILAALRVDPEEADNLAIYALVVAKDGQIEKARKLIAWARQIDPQNEQALRVQSVVALAAGDDREALLRSRELLAINPEDVSAHRIAGAVLHDGGSVGDAAPHFRSAVVLDPAERELGEAARENLLWRHPLMWPLRPVQRFGIGPIWIAGVAILYLSRLGPPWVTYTATGTWLAYCVYSWVVPPLLRRRLR